MRLTVLCGRVLYQYVRCMHRTVGKVTAKPVAHLCASGPVVQRQSRREPSEETVLNKWTSRLLCAACARMLRQVLVPGVDIQ